MSTRRMLTWLVVLGALLLGGTFGTAVADEPAASGGEKWWQTEGQAAQAASDEVQVAQLADCPTDPTFSFSVADPEGDAFPFFGVGPVVHDITGVSVEGDDTTICLTMTFAEPIEPPDALAERSIIAVVDFDLDEDISTGFFGTVDALCPDRAGLGVDAELLLIDGLDGMAVIFFADGSPDVLVPVSFDETSFTVAIPTDVLGGSEFNFAGIVGTFEEPTDCVPNGGSIHSPDGSIVPPPPPLELSLEIDPVGTVVPSQNVVTVSGTVTCSQPAEVFIFGDATQRAGRVFITGFFDTFVFCDGETPWSATFSGQNGRFAGGKAEVNAFAFAFSAGQFAEDFDQETVHLRGGPAR